MKANQIFLSDIQKLVQLFTQKNVVPFIFDPNDRLIVDHFEEYTNEENDFLVLVNLAGKINQFKSYRLEEFDLILDFGEAELLKPFNKKSFCVLNHPNGKMRWLYKANRLDGVLAFYNDSGLRGKLISNGIKLLSYFKLGKFIAKEKLNVYHKSDCPIESLIGVEENIDSLFMGTPGVQQTALFSLRKNGVCSRFLKIPFTSQAKKLLINEKSALANLGSRAYQFIKLPKVGLLLQQDAMLVENLRNKQSKHHESFTNLHALAIEELHHTNKSSFPLKQAAFWQQIQMTLNGKLPKHKELQKLYQLCGELNSKIDPTHNIVLASSHGDFTPWNMLVEDERLSLYDWELWSAQAPALFDFFHFHYQRGILMQHLGFREIKKQIATSLKMAPIESLVSELNLDVEQLHLMYLLRTATYFTQVFDKQELTIQNEWQIKCWQESIEFELSKLGAKTNGARINFLKGFNAYLQEVPHAFLKFDYDNLEALPSNSDIDLAIEKASIKEIEGFCKKHPLVEKVSCHSKSFMTKLELFFYDGQYLSIDLIHKFQRKSINMLSCSELLYQSTMSERGVKVPALKHDLTYAFLFYTLNNAPIPLRYYRLFEQSSEEAKAEVFQYFKNCFGISFSKISSFFTDGKQLKPALIKQLRSRSLKSGIQDNFNYLLDVLKGFIKPEGFIITFSGVDGVGKSTILQLVEEKLKKQYRKEVVLLRHRPGILPILSAFKHGKKKADHIASVTLPRKGKNNNSLSSLLRFAYYYTDYLFGQIYVYFRYIVRGKVVLYDRYYFDFINDAKRSNIQINRNLAKALYGLILKPKLNIFLYADPKIIRSRKQELEEQDIRELTKNYFNLFKELASKSKASQYTSIQNLDLDKTIDQILKAFGQVA